MISQTHEGNMIDCSSSEDDRSKFAMEWWIGSGICDHFSIEFLP